MWIAIDKTQDQYLKELLTYADIIHFEVAGLPVKTQ